MIAPGYTELLTLTAIVAGLAVGVGALFYHLGSRVRRRGEAPGFDVLPRREDRP